MYSVEDLLISHGYKPSRDLPAEHEGRQPARARERVGRGLVNGCEDGPAAFLHNKASLGTRHVSDSENEHHALRARGEPQSASAARMSEEGFSHQPRLAWSSQHQSGHNHAYWRRGQEVGGLLAPRDREDLQVRGVAQAQSLPIHTREGSWEVGGRTENVMKKVIWEEKLRMGGPDKWQNVSLESWNQTRKLGRQMSDGDGEKLFPILYPFMRGEQVLNSQSKGKSQSLPRVLSPESLSCMEIPISDGYLPDVSRMPFYPDCAPNLESTRNPEKGGSSAPLLWPKFGRPLKPPSYDSHQHSRAGVENSDHLDSQQADLSVSYRQEVGLSASGLEPPLYVPPPSYKSPPQHITNPYGEDVAPRHVYDGRHHPIVEAAASFQFPSGSLGTGNELLKQPHPITAYDGSVQYIPFDDPRIRHIKLAQPQGFCDKTKMNEKLYNPGLVSAPEPAHRSMHHDGAILNPQSIMPASEREKGPALADPSPPWLWGQLPRDGENGGFPDQRDHCVMRGQWPDVRGSQHGQAESQASSPNPQGESTCETQTMLKKFETGIKTKKSSKKKMNETIFCLVSIPVKSESHLPDIDTNNNDLKQSADKKHGLDKSPALQEQSLLSMSSTDLELQALTGSMAGRPEFEKQDLGEPEEDKQTDDLRFIHPMKHRVLQYSGSWPGHQYKDQQTQTTFTEESKSPQPLPAKSGGPPDAVLAPNFLDPPASEAQMHMALASSDQNQKPNVHHLKDQVSLNPSSYSAFSRTSLLINQAPMPKVGQSQPCMDDHGRGPSPVPRGEVVKGATTGPCNNQQLFGQFLLKPVNRRPWDLISQLESFNKELQEEEESSQSSSGSESSETGWQPEGCILRNLGFSKESQERRGKERPRRVVPEEPVFRSGRVKSKSESWSEEQKPATCHQGARPQCLGPWHVEDSRGEALLSTQASLITERRNQEVGKRIKELAVSPSPVKRITSSRSRDTVASSAPAELREAQDGQQLSSALKSVEPSQAAPPTPCGGEERSTVGPLSLASKPFGLSVPDLRSVGLTPAQEWSASKLDGSSDDKSAIEIPPNESLQTRAARILGIEVAVESLLPGTRRTGHNQPSEPNGSARSLVTPREEPVSSPALPDGPTVSNDAFYGRRKCGWTKSPLFVGERDSAPEAPRTSEHSGVDRVVPSKATDPESQPSDLESFNHKGMGTEPPFRSTLFHFIERAPSVAGSEKRLRSTSKVIESLQEKLASPPRRADPDRLMRMKEVSSMSRMRRLSSRSTDSVEDAEELKAERGPGAQPRGLVTLTTGDLARKVGHAFSVSKGTLSLEENGHRAPGREKNLDRDFWCPGEESDSYDPSRVERV
ncbi:junctional protein associated with coronary artery disease isoform X1 [Pipistrellus kuhlii]|uniref:Junctional cadherin 5 associated n=2 Tax=Pipistrellus kuhlii TaxID=59472 RepID=A0A7J8B1B3_PIPKU|nr:junctional protein associated with coronary artery disease isoform X1 [Pipistrellus kuhlii]XP_036309355.1 junctional protein associated with coronary artery disease isoform X1 [Pipistrellus kuhlii]XP_045441937.1 junctional protein associated with coronary artery disease isoform X1 [Pipistrellus kuhlii]KAF6392276.1 junctional cadherin 5 associated [Pipistrellus kuhlii]